MLKLWHTVLLPMIFSNFEVCRTTRSPAILKFGHYKWTMMTVGLPCSYWALNTLRKEAFVCIYQSQSEWKLHCLQMWQRRLLCILHPMETGKCHMRGWVKWSEDHQSHHFSLKCQPSTEDAGRLLERPSVSCHLHHIANSKSNAHWSTGQICVRHCSLVRVFGSDCALYLPFCWSCSSGLTNIWRREESKLFFPNISVVQWLDLIAGYWTKTSQCQKYPDVGNKQNK